jgi:hypothetical protein
MKRIFTLIAALFLSSGIFAQFPQKMSYQCVVRNTSGDLISSQDVGIRISILQGSSTGTMVYQETFNPNPTTNVNGLLSIEIGSGTPVSGIFSDIDWSAGPYFLKTETDPTGGTSYSIVGTSQLLSVPYALHSETAANIFSGNYSDLTNLPTTLAGYGITDGMNVSHAAYGITPTLITDWNTAFDWGNHAGLYRPIGYVPAWTDITGKPSFAAVATSGSYNDLSDQPIIPSSLWAESGSNIYFNTGNVGIGTSSPATSMHVHGNPVTSRGQLSLSAPSGEDIFLSFYESDIFKSYLWYDVSDEDLRLQNFTSGELNLQPYGGEVGIGTNSPRATLEINGQVMITGGSPAAGQVLTSDANGLATWEPPPTSTEDYVCFEVKRNAVYTWPTNASVQPVDFSTNSTVWRNDGGAFNQSNSRFTAPENGIYTFHGKIDFRNLTTGSLIYAFIRISGGTKNFYGTYSYANNTNEGAEVSVTLYMSAGQYAELWGYVNTGTPPAQVYANTSATYAFTWFTGAKVN